MTRKVQITVIGDSIEIETNNKIAYDIGKFIAEKGWVLINGGRAGVMESSARGASDAGGIIVSITPDDDLFSANEFSTITIPSGMGFARNMTNVLAGDVIVGIGGGAGTLSEIGYAWCYRKPIIVAEWSQGWSSKLADTTLDHRHNMKLVGAKDMDALKKILEETVNNLDYLNKPYIAGKSRE
ncbi:MAG: TIGR00725 family protein [Spirochaetes bacterium GWF1_51_8]|nr:MAG: TIGR00725 family protein [Spirochaetes bacterium GWF1_51_8]